MDKEALEHSLARQLITTSRTGTAGLCDELMEVPTSSCTSREHFDAEFEALFRREPRVLFLSGSLPVNGSHITVDICDTPIHVSRGKHGRVHGMVSA